LRRWWSGPSGAEDELSRGQGNLLELLQRLTEVLQKRVLQAAIRTPELLFEELEDLNLVLELRERIAD
jgi:hypothetical protein